MMKSIPTILLFLFCWGISIPMSAQVTKSSRGKKNKKSIKKGFQKQGREVQSEFELEYKLDCNLKLDRARALFEKGLLQKIPPLLRDCAGNENLNHNTKLAILKLLTETHLFLNEEILAVTYYEDLLKLDPFYEPQPQIDHPELVHLSKQFKVFAPFSFGLKTGGQLTIVNSQKQFLNQELTETLTDDYSSKSDLLIGAFVSFRPGGGKVEFSLETIYSTYRYGYQGKVTTASSTGSGNLFFTEKNQIWQFPLSVKYLFGNSNMKPYAYIGATTMVTLNARLENIRISKEENNTFSQSQNTGIDILNNTMVPLRDPINFSAHLGIGIQFNLKRFYLFSDLRYNRMLTNVVDTKNRLSNKELTDDFWHVDNDFGMDSFALNFGFGYALFRSVRAE